MSPAAMVTTSVHADLAQPSRLVSAGGRAPPAEGASCRDASLIGAGPLSSGVPTAATSPPPRKRLGRLIAVSQRRHDACRIEAALRLYGDARASTTFVQFVRSILLLARSARATGLRRAAWLSGQRIGSGRLAWDVDTPVRHARRLRQLPIFGIRFGFPHDR
jgi:hypothetical protein